MRMGRNETGYGAVHWIHVARDTVQRSVLLDTVMNLLVCFVSSFVYACVCEVNNKYLSYEISNNKVFKVKVKVTVRLSVHSQSVLAKSPLRITTRDFFN
jgi:hypothetical protein